MSNSPSPQSLNTDPAHISYILDQAIDLMPIGIWLLDAGGSIIYGNETARKIWGEIRFLHESEFDQFEAWTVPGNVPIQKNEWAAHQALQGELTLNQEIKIKGFDGVFRYVRNSAIPIRNANGEITHCVAINQEITDLRLSEDRLAATVAQLSDKVQEAEMLTLAVNQAAEHFVITDPDGVIIFANESVEEVTGYSKDEVMGSKAGKLWSKPMPAAFYQEMWQRIKIEKKPFEGEIINRKKNGQEYIAHATISPILNDQQELLFFLAMERDISKEKAVDRAKTEFVSFASHQLRTPLTAVRWYTEMLLSNDAGPLTDQQRKFVTEISEASLRMVQLVSALLNVSRIEMGTFSVTPEPLEIEEIIQTVLDDLQPEIKRKKIKLETNIHNIPTMLLDKKLTHIVVENLLGNAVKYTPENGIVKLDLQEVHEQRDFLGNNVPTDSLTFSVQDSGIGIPATQHDKIFSKLFRADNAVVYDTTGTGLGLYITKSIIEHSGGKIWFQSEENKGTTFTFWLPLKGMESKDGGKQLEQ